MQGRRCGASGSCGRPEAAARQVQRGAAEASVHAGWAEEALEQLAAAGLSQRCGTLGSVASGLGRRWPAREGCREETVGEENLGYECL